MAQPFQAVVAGVMGVSATQAGKPVPPGRQGLLRAIAGHLEGNIHLKKDGVVVAGRNIRWDAVISLMQEKGVRSIWAPEVVRLADGQMWRVELMSLSGGKLKVRSMAFGERELGLGAVAALDFLPNVPAPGRRDKPNTLYRERGEPIPGQLLWIDRHRLAIDSPLGALTLSREGTRRYLFKPPRSAPASGDEVSLIDGSVLRGRAVPGDGSLTLHHDLLGEVVLPERLVRSVLRHPRGVVHLAETRPSRVEAEPLIAEPVLPTVASYPEAGPSVGWPGRLRAIRSLRLEPKARMEFALSRGGSLRATVVPVERAAGKVAITIISEGKSLLEKTISPGDEPLEVQAEVAAGTLAIAADFVLPMRFPCGVELLDPHVVER